MTDKLLCGISESTRAGDTGVDQDQKPYSSDAAFSNKVSAPKLVLMAGFAGAGKTTLAGWLYKKFGWIILSKDQLKRDRLVKGEEVTQAAEQAFEDLFALIETQVIENGVSVIVDTSNEKPFVFERILKVLERMTDEHMRPLLKVVLCVASKEERTKRLLKRGSVFSPFVKELPTIWDDSQILQLYRHLFLNDPQLLEQFQHLLNDSVALEHFQCLPGDKAFIVNTYLPLEIYSQSIGEDLESYLKNE